MQISPAELNQLANQPPPLIAAGPCGLFRSTDGGKSWFPVGNHLPGVNDMAMDVSTGTLYAGTEDGLWKSGDQGKTWTRVGLNGGNIAHSDREQQHNSCGTG